MLGSSAQRVGQEQSLQYLEMIACRVAMGSIALRVTPVRGVHSAAFQTILKELQPAQRVLLADFLTI